MSETLDMSVKNRDQKTVRTSHFTGIRPCKTKDIVHAFCAWMYLNLVEGNAVQLPNIGIINHRWRKGRGASKDTWILKLKVRKELKAKMVELAEKSPFVRKSITETNRRKSQMELAKIKRLAERVKKLKEPKATQDENA